MTKLERKGIAKLNERYFRLDSHEYTVYVEGDIDKLFWEQVFPQDDTWKPNIVVLKEEDGKVISGWKNLIDYLEKNIKNKEIINYIIAIDGDYNAILHYKPLHNNVIMTPKYNIENYIFCPKSLNKCMKQLSLGVFNNEELIRNRIEKFSKMLKTLIIVDCVNIREQLEITNYGLQEKDLQSFVTLKNYIKNFNLEYQKILDENKNIMGSCKPIDYIRWKCFLKQLNKIIENIVTQHVKKENKTRKNNKIRTPHRLRVEEGLYMYCIGNCKTCNENCDDFNTLKKQAESIFNNIKMII